MPLPIVWLGAAAVSALAVNEVAKDRKKQQAERFSKQVKTFDKNSNESSTAIYPTDLFSTAQEVRPTVGSIVCCGIGGVFEHTGIWVGDNTIIEMDGNGLIKPVSLQRFTEDRTGRNVFVACDSKGKPLALDTSATAAISQVFTCEEYDMISNNCHQFVWQCFSPNDKKLTTFKELNIRIAKLFNRKIYWDLCEVTLQ
jgi:hypothetical protein